ncbi:hypothetical protein JXA56_00105 [Candidatus Micrarchaeota archaeon]|nr:hypothetical protein [Candidatus Micrarchaeota archaeon]
MFETLSRSFGLVKKSFEVLLNDKKLLLFPAISSIVLIGVLISFIGPALLADSDIVLYGLFALFYFASYAIIIFFNSSLIYAAGKKMDGKPVTLGESISFSLSRLGSILSWAAIAATVGMILSILRGQAEDGKGIGMVIAKIVISLIGLAWSLATYFVVPVLVFENVGPFEAIKRSVAIIRKTWGESIVGGISMSVVFLLFYLFGGVLAAGLFIFGGLIPALIIALPYFMLVFLAQGAIEGIFVAALYRYATTGQSAIFAKEDLDAAFRKKT